MLKLNRLIAQILLLLPLLASAHEGHGIEGQSHWHASDALIWSSVIGAALWFWSRRNK
jgi:hypothetical protein